MFSSDDQWPGEKRASFFGLVECKGEPLPKTQDKRAPLGTWVRGPQTNGGGPCGVPFGKTMHETSTNLKQEMEGSTAQLVSISGERH